MLDKRQIIQVNAEATGREAQDKRQPYRFYNVEEVDMLYTFPFPKLGDYIPVGWMLYEEWFCDKTGMGDVWEPALTHTEVREKIKLMIAEHGIDNVGFGLGEEGQYQVFVRVYTKAS